jgi:hypothetical protein
MYLQSNGDNFRQKPWQVKHKCPLPGFCQTLPLLLCIDLIFIKEAPRAESKQTQ